MAQLDGPRLDAASGTADSLVVLLHGYGADGNDLIALGQEWAQQLPDTAFASPHAPMPLQMAGVGGRQWFELTERNPTEYWRGVTEAAPLLNTFLDDELARHAARRATRCRRQRTDPPGAGGIPAGGHK